MENITFRKLQSEEKGHSSQYEKLATEEEEEEDDISQNSDFGMHNLLCTWQLNSQLNIPRWI